MSWVRFYKKVVMHTAADRAKVLEGIYNLPEGTVSFRDEGEKGTWLVISNHDFSRRPVHGVNGSGERLRSAVRGLRVNGINFVGCSHTSVGIVPVTGWLETRRFAFQNCHLDGGELGVLAQFPPYVQQLSFCGPSAVSDARLCVLHDMSELRVLGLGDTAISSEGFASFMQQGNGSALVELDLSMTDVGRTRLPLAKSPMLKELSLRGCRMLSVEGLVGLQDSPSLVSLDLGHANLVEECLDVIAGCGWIEELDLSGMSWDVNVRSVRKLTKLSKLERLVLDRVPLSNEELHVLGEISSLKKLHVSSCAGHACITAEGLASLAKLPNLETLFLCVGRFEHKEVEAMGLAGKLVRMES